MGGEFSGVKMNEKHGITLDTHGSERPHWSSITMVTEYWSLVAIPYVDALLENIENRFTDEAVKIVTAMSIFSPSLLLTCCGFLNVIRQQANQET